MFLLFLALGIACLVAALFVTRQTWRTDVQAFNRRSRLFQIALHPERFATADRLPFIRSLNLVGATLILCAMATVAYDVILSISAG